MFLTLKSILKYWVLFTSFISVLLSSYLLLLYQLNHCSSERFHLLDHRISNWILSLIYGHRSFSFRFSDSNESKFSLFRQGITLKGFLYRQVQEPMINARGYHGLWDKFEFSTWKNLDSYRKDIYYLSHVRVGFPVLFWVTNKPANFFTKVKEKLKRFFVKIRGAECSISWEINFEK